MARPPDAALQVALDQRRARLELAQRALSERERVLRERTEALLSAQARTRMVLLQIDNAQQPAPGVSLPVVVLGDLERLLDWCQVQVMVAQERLRAAEDETHQARGQLASAHQAVRALELVLAGRAAERAEVRRREELR
ncbi:MAG: hypothetical protein M3336_03745, partial [Chloroflexota bacterium]|nr:hypothetical protein [Chloroflexota bacterium]